MKKISLIFNLIFILFFFWYFFIHIGIGAYYDKYFSEKELFSDNRYYSERVRLYEELNKRLNPNIQYNVFTGDSLIEEFPLEEIFSEKNVLNRGIRSDSTVGALRRLERNVNNINMSRCFLLIGYNDLECRTAEDIYKNISEIMLKIKAKRKYFISILPCRKPELNVKIDKINKMIELESKRGDFKYIDVGSFFKEENGRLKWEYFYDNVHLNISGYFKLQAALNPYINN